MKKSPQQKLIDLMFEMCQVSAYHFGKLEKYDREKHMEWVAYHLREAGFDTVPMGMSWGILVNKKEGMNPSSLDIVENIRQQVCLLQDQLEQQLERLEY